MIRKLPNLRPIHRSGHYSIYKRSARTFKNAQFELYYQFDLVLRFATEGEALAAIPLHKEWIEQRSQASSIETHEINMQRFPDLWERWTEIGEIPDWLKTSEVEYWQWLRGTRPVIVKVPDFYEWLRNHKSIKPIKKTERAPKAEWNEADKFHARGMGIKWEEETQ